MNRSRMLQRLVEAPLIPPQSGLINWYKLNESPATNGTTIIDYGIGDDGVLNTDIAEDLSSSYGLNFTGKDYINFPTASSIDITNGFTLSVWLKNPNSEYVFDGDRYRWTMGVFRDDLIAIIEASDNFGVARNSVSTMYTIVAQSNGNLNLYTDSTLVGNTVTLSLSSFGSDRRLFADKFNTNISYEGEARDFFIYDRALSSSEITTLYQATL